MKSNCWNNLVFRALGTSDMSKFINMKILYMKMWVHFSAMSGRVFLGWTCTMQGLVCLAQGHNAVTSVRLEPATPQSRVKHSTTEPLRSPPLILFYHLMLHIMVEVHGWIQRGAGGPNPLKLKNIGFPSNIDPDTLKITKLPSQHSRVGQFRHASETWFQWRFAGGPMMAYL